MQRSYLVPSYTTAKDGEDEALDVLATCSAAARNSRLYRALVMESASRPAPAPGIRARSLDATRFGLYATAAAGVPLEKVEGAIDAVIETLLDKGVAPEELERAKSRMIADYIYAQDNQSTLARMYGAALTTGSTVEAVLARPDAAARRDASSRCAMPRGAISTSAVGHRLSHPGSARSARRRNS